MSLLPQIAFDPSACRIVWRDAQATLPMCAVPCLTPLTAELYIPRAAAALSAAVSMRSDDDGSVRDYEMSFSRLDGSFDVFALDITFDADALLWCSYKAVLCGDSARGAAQTLDIRNTAEDSGVFQLTVYKNTFAAPKNYAGGVMYQIFCDRFAQSVSHTPKVKSDSVLVSADSVPKYPENPGDAVNQNDFFGGTLWGVAEKLDHIASLGVTAIYLNPIFDAHTNHKYDTGDYMKVDEMFGGDAALKNLIAECRKRGISLILDGVFNHTGSDSRYFNREGRYPGKGAYNSPKSPFYPWYTFKNYPDEYECWWGVKILPSLNKNSPSLREYLLGENGVVRHYLKMGISGWRLDVADELPDDFLRELHTAARSEKQDALIIGEVWEDASNKISYDVRRRYLRGGELDTAMNYPMRNAVIDYITYGDAALIGDAARTLYSHYPREASHMLMNILGTHDTVRIINLLGTAGADGVGSCDGLSNGEYAARALTAAERALGIARVKLAYLICASLPGVPCIYYGDEAGLEGWRDPFNRRFYPWENIDSELFAFYALLGKLRRENSVFADGGFEVELAENGVFVFTRGSSITVAVNLSAQDFTLTYKGSRTDLLSGVAYEARCVLPPNCGCMLKDTSVDGDARRKICAAVMEK
ncbi:MAG: glycoside hydrolase family 13 protein [Eubacteriales bacterium]